MELVINLTLQNDKVRFTGVSTSHPGNPVPFDYVPPLGDGQGFLGLEALVMSFAGCVSTGIVVLLRRMGRNVSGYHMKASGIRREEPLSLEKIMAEITVISGDATDEDVLAAIRQAEKISPVWIAIRNNVQVEFAHSIVKP